MRRALIPAQSSDLKVRANTLRKTCSDTLQKFCKDKVIENKLAPRTFDFNFQFSGGQTVISRSIVRLKALLTRAIEKKVPYIEYATDPFIKIVDRRTIEIQLTSLPETTTASQYDFERTSLGTKVILCASSKFGRTIERYVRYIRFLCLKHGLPIDVTAVLSVKLSSHSRKIGETLTTAQKRETKPEIQYVATLIFNLVYWVYNPYRDFLANVSATHSESMDDHIQRLLEEESESSVYNVIHWGAGNVIHGRPHLSNTLPPPRRWAFEKIFLYIPQMLRVLRTLTRMTSYVPTAFSIGTAESSGHQS